jgi:NADPH-dependent 2,4-dienoyl-CoA reductase/sulfur reductase-like enzyme
VGTCGLPYLISGEIESPAALVLETEEGIDLRCSHQVHSVDWSAQRVRGGQLDTGRKFDIAYDKLLLAPGGGVTGLARAFEGARRYSNLFVPRNLAEILRLDAFLRQARPSRALVIGGGYIGVELAEALSRRGVSLTLLEKGPSLMGLAPKLHEAVQALFSQNGIETVMQSGVVALSPQAGPVLTTAWGEKERSWSFDLVIVATGISPSSTLLTELSLAKSASGAVKVDSKGATSRPNVFAAGDCVEVEHAATGRPAHIPLARPAIAQGLAVAQGLLGESVSRRAWRGCGTLGLQLFDRQLAVTGLSPSRAADLGIETVAVDLQTPSRASYFPGGSPMLLRVLAEKRSGRVVGAQAFGREGPQRTIDLVSQLILQGGDMDQLGELETVYHPAMASIWEPLRLVNRRWPKEVVSGH